jgi:hypothetical protein
MTAETVRTIIAMSMAVPAPAMFDVSSKRKLARPECSAAATLEMLFLWPCTSWKDSMNVYNMLTRSPRVSNRRSYSHKSTDMERAERDYPNLLPEPHRFPKSLTFS